MTKSTWSAFVLLGLGAFPLAAGDAAGRWQLKGEVAGNPIVADCNFTQEASKLAGTCKAADMAAWIVAGEIQEKKITFHHDVEYGGSTYLLNYTGTFSSVAEAKGDIEVAGTSGEFTLTKASGAEPKQDDTPAAVALSGTWKIEADVAGETHSGTCKLEQAEEKLSGSCKLESGEVALTGEVKGKTVTWSHKGEYNGEALTANYKGTVESPTMVKGDLDVQPFDVSGTFTATKVQ